MKEFKEDDFLMLSGIQHYKFCKRQWALIHIENQWSENYRTFDGKLMHEKAHDVTYNEKRKNVVISRAMPVRSAYLGISGECDIVEFVLDENGIPLKGRQGKYKIYPVEYKRGKPKQSDEDVSQLIAQAMCLEEMFCTEIEKGYIFYGEIKRRLAVDITGEMKENVYETLIQMHDLYERHYTPKVKRTKICEACSLKNLCLPQLDSEKSAKKYMQRMINGEG